MSSQSSVETSHLQDIYMSDCKIRSFIIFSHFLSVLRYVVNPDTKVYEIVTYLLEHSSENSRTWSAHIRHLSRQYDLEDPLLCLRRDPPSKSGYKELIATKLKIRCLHIYCLMSTKILICFCELKPHSKIQNPRTSLLGEN